MIFNMKLNLWSQRDYLPVQEDDKTPLEKEVLGDFTQRRIALSAVLYLVATQSVLWILSIIYLLKRDGQSITLPLDGKFQDSMGNAYPAAAAVKYVTRTFEEDQKYMTLHGTPSNDTDQAWLNLMGTTEGLVQLSAQNGFDIDRLPDTIESKIHPGLFLYGLEVYHQLHCLDRIRKSFHPQYYFAGETEQEVVSHREHCLDHIRQSVICSGDFALDRWYYDPVDKKNWLKTDVPHLCRDYSVLQEWQEAHRINMLFGPA